MLLFSGLGSLAGDRLASAATGRRCADAGLPRRAGMVRGGVAGLQPVMLATLDWPWPLRSALVLAVLAPVSLALGLPFPLGLARLGDSSALPWAWGLNGAFSVVATPLANLIARTWGLHALLLCAAAMYAVALAALSGGRGRRGVGRWRRGG